MKSGLHRLCRNHRRNLSAARRSKLHDLLFYVVCALATYKASDLLAVFEKANVRDAANAELACEFFVLIDIDTSHGDGVRNLAGNAAHDGCELFAWAAPSCVKCDDSESIRLVDDGLKIVVADCRDIRARGNLL